MFLNRLRLKALLHRFSESSSTICEYEQKEPCKGDVPHAQPLMHEAQESYN